MLSFKNVKISKGMSGIEVDLNVAGQEFLKASPGVEYTGFLKKSRGMVQIDTEHVKENIKLELRNYEELNKEIIKTVLNNNLMVLQKVYSELQDSSNFLFEIDEFTGENSSEIIEENTSIFPTIPKEKSFFDEDFDINSLKIEKSAFSGKIKSFLKRLKDGAFDESLYVYNDLSPEEDTELCDCTYDLVGLKYNIIDKETQTEKTIYNSIPVPVLCRTIKATPYELFDYCDSGYSKNTYQRIRNFN